MKILRFVLFFGIIFNVWTADAKSMTAEVRVGMVDMQLALQSVNEGKNARSILEKEFNKKKEGLQKEEAEIKKLHEEFQKQSLVMNDETRVKKQAELQKRIIQFQEKTAISQTQIQQKERNLTEPLIKKIKTIISKLAAEKGYTVVLEKNENAVLYSLKKDDLTDRVIEIFNKKYK